jgi:heme/copper-type cytochrome/quinol oxidase subunit 3
VKERIVADLSRLPTNAFGARSVTWWGTAAFVIIEGMGFGLAIAVYLYLAQLAPEWPIGVPPPDLGAGSVLTAILLASAVPNHLSKAWAKRQDLPRVRWALIVMCLFGLLPLAVRAFEFRALNVWWDFNAYGSILWVMLGLHTAHLATDVVDTMVLTTLMWTRHGHSPRRFDDVTDNAFYWNFVVLSWLPIYLLIYWIPRW